MSNQDFDEMLNKYYKLKEKYEKTIKEVKLNIIKSPGTWKEKRREFSKLKFKCILFYIKIEFLKIFMSFKH